MDLGVQRDAPGQSRLLAMRSLTILYDAHCGLCQECRRWLGAQRAYLPLRFVPLQSAEVPGRFPGIEKFHPERRLVVVGDAGQVWSGDAAWIMCLWALRAWRPWALRLARPGLRPLARRLCALVSENRYALSRRLAWLRRTGGEPQALARLAALPEPVATCAVPPPLPPP